MPDPEPMAPMDATPDAPTSEPNCRACGAPLRDGQNWCLECGTATPQAAPSRAGLRTAGTVAALTLALVGGAVAASYAALDRGTDQTLVAAAPPSTATTPTTIPAVATTPTTAAAPTATTATAPADTTPSTAKAPVSPPVDTTPADTTPVDTSVYDTTTTDTVAPRSTSSPDATTTTTKTTATTPTTTTKKTTKPATTLSAITLSKSALSVYDPLGQGLTITDAELAADGNPATTFSATTADGPSTMRIGLAIDLKHAKLVKEIRLQTPTPGFSIAVYGSGSPKLPAALTDPAWTHLHNQIDIGSSNGDATIKLGQNDAGVSTYRYLLLWVTRPPNASPTSRAVLPADTTATTAVDPTDTTTTPSTSTTPSTTTTPTTTTATTPAPAPTTTAATPPPVTTTTTTATTPAPTAGPTVSIAELSVFS